MPHWPYFFDSAGIQTPVDSLTEAYKTNKKAYIQYLTYSNNKILNLIDEIKQNRKIRPLLCLSVIMDSDSYLLILTRNTIL
jgi:hypothetical protein